MRNPNDSEANEPLRKLDPTFCEMAVRMGGTSWGIEALSQREKALLCLLADICDHNLGLAFEMHFSMARANDVPLMAIKEVIFHAAPEAGYTNALPALVRFKELCKAHHLEEDIEEPAAQKSAVGSIPAEDLKRLDPRFEEAWRTGVTQQWLRPNLTLQERAILSIAAAVSNQTLGSPFKHFVAVALRQGVSTARSGAAISFMSEFGFGKAWQGLEALRSILPNERHQAA
ncbi:MAG: carboxymuconolactone decarboxylase family protein [Methylobacteriaceae bacterium]|nr:carboxymuconolactone decarboxylase family protein [Methylobacteriaceae bacterium]